MKRGTFIDYLVFPMGNVSVGEVEIKKREIEKKHGSIYTNEVISTYYNEIGIVFSIDEVKEEDALDWFETEQAENYGTVDDDELKAEFEKISDKEKNVMKKIKDMDLLVMEMKKEISNFHDLYPYAELTSGEKEKFSSQYDRVGSLSNNMSILEASIKKIL